MDHPLVVGTTSLTQAGSYNELPLIDASAATVALSEADLEHASDQLLAATTSSCGEPSTEALNKLEPEVLRWMKQCSEANGGLDACEDDVLYYFDTQFPEWVREEANTVLFQWLCGFLQRTASTTDEENIRFSATVKKSVLNALESEIPLPMIAAEVGLKSSTTLLYWRYKARIQVLDQERASDGIEIPIAQQKSQETGETPEPPLTPILRGRGRKRGLFTHEKALAEWILAHRDTPLTNQDIVNHLTTEYPEFVAGKSVATLSVWVTRFIKRYCSQDALNGPVEVIQSTQTGVKRREKRGSPGGYVLYNNEFKLNALKLLDQGNKTMSEVAEELGLKSANTLVYWNSIREKLAVADRKRVRLAGGGRPRTCTFEDELMYWMHDRHANNLGTDVTTVLEYMRTTHPSFTNGKKEPTLRKWILRFFKRYQQSSLCTGGEASATIDEEEETTGREIFV